MAVMKLGVNTGSLMNHFKSANKSVPVVGKGATELLWTDRHAFEVTEVSEDQKQCVIQRYDPKRVDKLGMSDCQHYEYEELTPEKYTLVFKWGSWRRKCKEIILIKSFKDKCDQDGRFFSYARYMTDEQKEAVYNGKPHPQNVVEGISKEVYKYHKINILFGSKQEYYDFTF